MGLDMYLKRIPKTESTEEVDKLLHENHETREELVKHGKSCNENFDETRHVESSEYFPAGWIGKDIGYWRKANHIHHWFVENVQGGIDQCQSTIVSKEQLEKLLLVCYDVVDKKDVSQLKTVTGFFFGGDEYDEYYFQSTQKTITFIEKALKETNWEKESIIYYSSW